MEFTSTLLFAIVELVVAPVCFSYVRKWSEEGKAIEDHLLH